MKHILFDLDGTLLPMNQEEFVRYYMPSLAKAYIRHGVQVEPKAFIEIIWKGLSVMVENDGSCTNEEAFWRYVGKLLHIDAKKGVEIAEEFYAGDFNQAIAATSPTKVSNEIIKTAKEKGMEVYLATNPVFPQCATMNRIRWAGLAAEDFRLITTYEDCRYCKPNVRYFQEIIDQFGLEPEECLMVGNDVEEDLSIRKLGVKTYLVTDCLENRNHLPIESDYMGTLEECLEFIRNL